MMSLENLQEDMCQVLAMNFDILLTYRALDIISLMHMSGSLLRIS